MILVVPVTSGAIFFRLYLAFWVILAHGVDFALFYAVDAWAGWLLPLALGMAWFVGAKRHAPLVG